MFLVAKTIEHTEYGKDIEYQYVFELYDTAENGKSTTRNEKVACSSQVTSSIKTSVFTMKTEVFRTFRDSLKDPKIGLALIWRYFFEGFKFLEKRDFEKPDFSNFFEVIHFW